MADEENFGHNPFRDLDASAFRQVEEPAPHPRGKAGAAGSQTGRGRHASCATAAPDAESEECEMFLAAMRGCRSSRAKYGSSGFLLSEQCAWPETDIPAQGKARRAAARQSQKLPLSQTVPDTAHAAHMCEERLMTDSESDIFLRAMANARPVRARGRDLAPVPAQAAPPAHGDMSLQELLESKLEFAVSGSREYFEGHVVGLDEMTMGKLRSGNLSPEAHLDLHGLTAQQAFEAMRDFMRGAWYKGLRTVLIVPGRGRNSPDGLGILREKLQFWLVQEPFKRVVLAFCTAQPHDGGPGSVYVLLRKYRKKGRISWERIPLDSDLYAV